jgi:hypothetical protein
VARNGQAVDVVERNMHVMCSALRPFVRELWQSGTRGEACPSLREPTAPFSLVMDFAPRLSTRASALPSLAFDTSHPFSSPRASLLGGHGRSCMTRPVVRPKPYNLA